jgi:hypothetical protein
MHASLVPLMQTLRQQWSCTPGGWSPYQSVAHAVRCLLASTHAALEHTHALVPAALQVSALQGVMRVMQQLYECGALLPAAAAGTAAGGRSSSLSTSTSASMLYSLQCSAASTVHMLQDILIEQQLNAIVKLQVKQLLLDQEVQSLLLQPFVACAALLHQHHEAQQQQQQQRQRRKARPLQHELAIPAFHTELLLPGGQAYVNAAAAELAEDRHTHGGRICSTWEQASITAGLLSSSLKIWACNEGQQQVGNAIMLSASAVRLVLELQLLAAEELQRQQQQQQQQQQADEQQQNYLVMLLANCSVLLRTQIQANLQRTSEGMSPEVLQQAGMQLLQALAAPLQQLQLLQGQQRLSHRPAPFALRAAAEGLTTTESNSACKQCSSLSFTASAAALTVW